MKPAPKIDQASTSCTNKNISSRILPALAVTFAALLIGFVILTYNLQLSALRSSIQFQGNPIPPDLRKLMIKLIPACGFVWAGLMFYFRNLLNKVDTGDEKSTPEMTDLDKDVEPAESKNRVSTNICDPYQPVLT